MVGIFQRKLNRSILRACIGSADDGRLSREACNGIMTIQFLPRMMLVGSRCNLIGMLGGVDIFFVNTKSDGALRHQWCVGMARDG